MSDLYEATAQETIAALRAEVCLLADQLAKRDELLRRNVELAEKVKTDLAVATLLLNDMRRSFL